MFSSEQIEAEGALGVLGADEAGEAAQEAAQVAEEAFRQVSGFQAIGPGAQSMMRVSPWVATGLILCFSVTALNAAVRGNSVKYVGGTVPGIAENSDGNLDLSSDGVAVFTGKNGQKFTIPFRSISSLEYGQKAGRRVGVALAISPVALFSKKRKHFLSIAYLDEQGNKQGAVLELAKGIVKATLTAFETKSGRQVEYDSEEARKHAAG
jgi:hypothetical protein